MNLFGNIFDRYLFKSLFITTILVSIVLAAIIFLTQSLRFLELVINSGASSVAFWLLTMLALPRFFEVILPIAVMAGTVFVYNKMIMDSEIVVMRASGAPPISLARPALALAGIVAIFLWIMTSWAGPTSLAKMHEMRQVIKAQYSTLLFREGVFNSIGSGLTVYIGERTRDGELHSLMIHDNREKDKPPVTVLAKRGIVVATPDGQQVVVYDGTRQDLNPKTGALSRLDFSRYMIDLPDGSGPVRKRWREPDERTLWELFHPNPENKRDVESSRDFSVEIHRRLTAPLLAPAFTIITLAFMLLGPVNRRGQGWRITLAIISVMLIQGLYLSAFNLSRQSDFGLPLMYALIFIPIIGGSFLLSRRAEDLRQKLMFNKDKAGAHE